MDGCRLHDFFFCHYFDGVTYLISKVLLIILAFIRIYLDFLHILTLFRYIIFIMVDFSKSLIYTLKQLNNQTVDVEITLIMIVQRAWIAENR